MSDERSAPRGGNYDPGHADRALRALLFFVLLAIAGWFVIDKIADDKRIQDCVMSGRRNCAPLPESMNR